ncbi:MAG: hypothetical protein V5A72_03545 [Candidatus Nanohaloarchaea archaeon]
MPAYQTEKTEQGIEIKVKADKAIVLVIQEDSKERIFLPPFNTQQDSYYVEPEQGIVETEEGFRIKYPGEPTSIELFSK